MTRVVADERLGKFARQQADLFRRVCEGSVDIELASRWIQKIMEGTSQPTTTEDATYEYEHLLHVMADTCLMRPVITKDFRERWQQVPFANSCAGYGDMNSGKPAAFMLMVGEIGYVIPNTTVWERLEATGYFECEGQDWPGSRACKMISPGRLMPDGGKIKGKMELATR